MSERVGYKKSKEDDVLQLKSRSMSDPTLTDIIFKNKMALVWTTLKNLIHMITGSRARQASAERYESYDPVPERSVEALA